MTFKIHLDLLYAIAYIHFKNFFTKFYGDGIDSRGNNNNKLYKYIYYYIIIKY